MPAASPDWSLAPPGAATRPLHAATCAGLPALLGRLDPGAAAFLRQGGFAAEAGRVALLPGAGGVSAAVLGLGAEAGPPWPYGAAPLALPEGSAWHLGEGCDPAAATLGWMLGAYRFTRHKAPARAPARLRLPDGAEEARVLAEATNAARDLINLPAADLGPAERISRRSRAMPWPPASPPSRPWAAAATGPRAWRCCAGKGRRRGR